MDKKKTSQKPQTSCPKEVSINDFSGLDEWHPKTELLNKSFVLEVVVECLENGDPTGAIEAVLTYFRAANRRKLSKNAHVPRSTIEHCLQHGNPTLETAFKLLSATNRDEHTKHPRKRRCKSGRILTKTS
jgi:DNA-binding phage protein